LIVVSVVSLLKMEQAKLGVKMVGKEDRLSAESTIKALEEVLARLERAILAKQAKFKTGSSEQADFINQLEKENRALSRELEVARDNVEKLEERLEKLEKAGASAEKDIGMMVRQLDMLISDQKEAG
jgi:predicted nuclease with TOPRIM domain